MKKNLKIFLSFLLLLPFMVLCLMVISCGKESSSSSPSVIAMNLAGGMALEEPQGQVRRLQEIHLEEHTNWIQVEASYVKFISPTITFPIRWQKQMTLKTIKGSKHCTPFSDRIRGKTWHSYPEKLRGDSICIFSYSFG